MRYQNRAHAVRIHFSTKLTRRPLPHSSANVDARQANARSSETGAGVSLRTPGLPEPSRASAVRGGEATQNMAGCRIGVLLFVVGAVGGRWDRPAVGRSGMTHYLLAVHGPAEMDEFGNYGSKEQMEEAFASTGAFNGRLRAGGYWVFAGGLQPVSTATVVDGRGERLALTDGPYLESKEVIAGFWVIDAPDLDVALKLAAEGSQACRGTVEVRPFDGVA